MARRKQQQYLVKEPVRGSFVGAHGRVHYKLEAGIVNEKDVDAEVLAVLLATGAAVKAAQPADTKESA